MKSEQRNQWPLFFLCLFLICSRAFPQTPPVSMEGNRDAENGGAMAAEPARLTSFTLEPDGRALPPPPQTPNKPGKEPYGWHIAVYPALVWAPVFGASVTLPPTPSQPITMPGPSGTTDSALNAAYFGGTRLEIGKWSGDLLFMWAALSAERQSPLVKVNLDFVFGDALIGREVLPGFYVQGGVRRVALDLHATVESSSATRSPGFWDPIIGVTYRRQLGRKWRILVHGDGGGFGAGSDVDLTATGRAEWQFTRHFGLTMGYGGLHVSESDTQDGRTLKISPTLHGPIFGLGIYF
jgi:hypothetical protein